jgi:putative inorganic carbon (HCO3(-)) transporter
LPTLLDWIGTSGTIQGWDTRVEIWSRALYMIQDFPFTGVGTGTFYSVVQILYPFFLIGPDKEILHAHNLLLQVAVDLGIPGLIAFLALLMGAFWSALCSVRTYVARQDTVRVALTWAGVASLTGMLTHGIVDAATWIQARIALLPWIVLGMLMALSLQAREIVTHEKQTESKHLPKPIDHSDHKKPHS